MKPKPKPALELEDDEPALETMEVTVSEWVVESLDVLALSGRFGATPAAVAEELLRAKLREVEREGWLER